MKSTLWLVIVIAGIVAALFFISSGGKKVPAIPGDADHRVITTQEACLTCHAPGKKAPLRENHPPKEQCLICHKAG